MSEPLVIASQPADGVKVLSLNRPTKRNALSQDLIGQLLKELASASTDDGVKAIIITGSTTFFCAGADIKEISELNSEGARRHRYLENLANGLDAVRKPLLAAVEGMALGGGFELAMACDMIFASNTSKFGLPEVSIGLIPGVGGTQRLTNAVGKYKAMHMILTGTPIPAVEAHAANLVSGLHEPGTVLEKTIETASKLASLSPTALSLAKEAVCRSDNLGRDDEFERSLYYFAFGTDDKREGVGAFLEKRAPVWGSKSK
ncbi:hypothetical protein N3K66_006333 [Trichothecium roseum]|uniref:Uncharacterized protein n=1 Tax=Trichothecium roseum TaxID=47278 RepID=A0ACC0UWS1_9HYPO|nr:hypothetical protein N3K66_006333 [Trichothecium roseum]